MSCKTKERVFGHAWHEILADGRAVAILLLGVVIFGFGIYEKIHTHGGGGGDKFVFGGAAIMMLGVLLPAVSEAEVGPGTLKFKKFLQARDADYSPFVVTERTSLTNFATLLIGSDSRAVEIVEEAFAITYAELRQVSPDDLRVHMLCTIVRLACGHQRLFGSAPAAPTRKKQTEGTHDPATRLAQFPIDARALALLADHQCLETAQVALIMELPLSTVELRLREVREQLSSFAGAPA